MNAVAPAASFDLGGTRFDALVARAFAETRATRHARDRLIARLHRGDLDALLLRARCGFEALPEAVERRAALNVIDFAFEAFVLPSLSPAQATAYFEDVEATLPLGEASGADGPGPLWVDTVHHVCVFSVLFQLAAFLGRARGIDRIVLLHQGQRPEPRLAIVANLLHSVHGIGLLRVPLRGRWFQALARHATPGTAIFSLTDMPPEALGPRPAARRRRARLDLHAPPDVALSVGTASGSASFARRLGATHVVLDYPGHDRVRLRPYGEAGAACCPLQDWVFWPLLGAAPHASAVTGPSAMGHPATPAAAGAEPWLADR